MTEAGPFERLLTVRMDEAEFEGAKNKAARKLSGEMKIKGFRPGKAPRAIVERMVGAETLRSEAIDEALPSVVGDAIAEAALDPVTRPSLESVRDTEDGGIELDVRITLWPAVDAVPEYNGRTIEVDVPEVTDEEVETQVIRLREQYAELEDVDRPAGEGDYVMINVTTLAGDEQIDDATASDLLYEVGSRSFIEGLDDLLAGSSAGDIREGPATLPDGFGDRGGETVTLRVLVKGVRGKRLPEVTDEWVADVSEFETIGELTDTLRDNLMAMKLHLTSNSFEEKLVGQLVQELDLELPDALIQAEMEATLSNMAHSLEDSGIDLTNYLRITGQDEASFSDDLRSRADRALKTRILLEGVAGIEELTVDDDELVAAIEELASSSESSPEELRAALTRSGQVDALTGDILRRKALERMVSGATAVDAEGKPVDLAPSSADKSEDANGQYGTGGSRPTADVSNGAPVGLDDDTSS